MPAWFLKTATAIESMKFGQQEVGNNIHDLQTASRGLVLIKTSCSVRKLDGTICSSAGEQQQCWREHFLKVLNIQSTFDPTEIELVRVREVSDGLALPPTADEVQTAINHLSNGKAAGSSGILPEMVKVNCNLFYQCLFTLIRTVWDAGVVPQDWVDAEIVPIPKKVIYLTVTIGGALLFWMWWARCLAVCFRVGCSSFREFCLKHSAALDMVALARI